MKHGDAMSKIQTFGNFTSKWSGYFNKILQEHENGKGIAID